MRHEILNKDNYDACDSGIEFAEKYETLYDAWMACERGDWMAWFAEKKGVDKRIMMLVNGKCAETVIHLMKDERSIAAVKAKIAYGNGDILEKELDVFLVSARDAWASALNSAWDSSLAKESAATRNAARAARDSAWSENAENAMKDNMKKTAEICRNLLTDIIFENGKKSNK